jgi:hypothetical protein
MRTTQADTINSDLLAFFKQRILRWLLTVAPSDKSKAARGWHNQIGVRGKYLRRTEPAGIQSN